MFAAMRKTTLFNRCTRLQETKHVRNFLLVFVSEMFPRLNFLWKSSLWHSFTRRALCRLIRSIHLPVGLWVACWRLFILLFFSTRSERCLKVSMLCFSFQLESIRSHDTMERVVNQKYLRIVSFKSKGKTETWIQERSKGGSWGALDPPSPLQKYVKMWILVNVSYRVQRRETSGFS